jgi:hypothetical protein
VPPAPVVPCNACYSLASRFLPQPGVCIAVTGHTAGLAPRLARNWSRTWRCLPQFPRDVLTHHWDVRRLVLGRVCIVPRCTSSSGTGAASRPS